ncbi:MAG: hypothetical protein OQK24_05165 [Magnetovibrio sp.]|nr:hypothetical protein [Magnetovibrio sp.]
MNSLGPKQSGRRHLAFPGEVLVGAHDWLIPYSIPLRFFVAASFFQVLAWGLMALGYGDVAGFRGGPGVILAALHALTLGVLAMTAMGAAYQLLSVASGITLKSYFMCRLSSWAFLPGTFLLVGGMFHSNTTLMFVGGVLAVFGLLVFGAVIGWIFYKTQTLVMTVQHGWIALASLVLLGLAGVSLILDFDTGFLGTSTLAAHAELALTHAILGGFGFMGLMVMGFSYILVPMFALSPAPDPKPSTLAFGLGALGLVLALSGAWLGATLLTLSAVPLGLAAASIHIWLMFKAMRTGMKKRLGVSFVMVRLGWALMVLAILLGGLSLMFPEILNMPALFGFTLTFGWLLTFLTGVLQRILPFLAAMHAHKLSQPAPRLSELGQEGKVLKTHMIAHCSALTLVALGIASDQDLIILVGALVGMVGAVSFLWFTLGVSRYLGKLYNNEPLPEQP